MLIEAFILNGYESLAQVVGNLVHADGETVGVGTDVLVNLVALSVIDDGGFADSHDIRQTDRGGGGEDTAESTDTGGYAADADTDKSCQHDLDTGQSNFPSPFL